MSVLADHWADGGSKTAAAVTVLFENAKCSTARTMSVPSGEPGRMSTTWMSLFASWLTR